MDTGSGDADCGSTLSRGAKKLRTEILESGDELAKNPTLLFRRIGQVSEQEMGGSSGAMFSIFFEASGSKLECAESISFGTLVRAFKNGEFNVYVFCVFFVSALLRDYSLCWDC